MECGIFGSSIFQYFGCFSHKCFPGFQRILHDFKVNLLKLPVAKLQSVTSLWYYPFYNRPFPSKIIGISALTNVNIKGLTSLVPI